MCSSDLYALKYVGEKTLRNIYKYLYENNEYLVVEVNPFRSQVKIEDGRTSRITSYKTIQKNGWVAGYEIDSLAGTEIDLSGEKFNNKLINKVGQSVQEVLQILEDNHLWVTYCINRFENMDQILEDDLSDAEQIETLRLLKRSKASAIDTIDNINRYICYSVITYISAIVNEFFINLQEDLRGMMAHHYKAVEGMEEFFKNDRFNYSVYCELLQLSESLVLWDKWKEFVATRNIIIHNRGIINDVYLNLSKNYSRGALGEPIAVDRIYIEKSIRNIKRLIVQIESTLEMSILSTRKGK